jgi:hypothetical protein
MKEQTANMVTGLMAVKSIPNTQLTIPLQVLPEFVFSLCARLCLSVRLNPLDVRASFKNKP